MSPASPEAQGNDARGSFRRPSCGVGSSDKVRERIRDAGERLVAEHREALRILADQDPDAPRDSGQTPQAS
jgi:hypothetical protein